ELRIAGQHDDLVPLAELGQHHVHVPAALRIAVAKAVVNNDRHSPAPGHQRSHGETGKQVDLLPRSTRQRGHVEGQAVVNAPTDLQVLVELELDARAVDGAGKDVEGLGQRARI